MIDGEAVDVAIILLADDHAPLRMLARTLLSRVEGWRVTEASDGHEALQLARTQRFDLLILDQRMPGYTGLQIVRTLRTEQHDEHDEPMLLFSAFVDPEVEVEAERLGLITLPKSEITGLPSAAARALGRCPGA